MNAQLAPYASPNAMMNITFPIAKGIERVYSWLDIGTRGIFAAPTGSPGATTASEADLRALGATDTDALYLQIETEDGTLRLGWVLSRWLSDGLKPGGDMIWALTQIANDYAPSGGFEAAQRAIERITNTPEVQAAIRAVLAA